MRALILVSVLFGVVGCVSATGDAASHDAPVVGHVRLRGRTIDLTVDSVDARSGLPELRRTTAQRDDLVWAGTDDAFFDRESGAPGR